MISPVWFTMFLIAENLVRIDFCRSPTRGLHVCSYTRNGAQPVKPCVGRLRIAKHDIRPWQPSGTVPAGDQHPQHLFTVGISGRTGLA
jgi:hypothetical protein